MDQRILIIDDEEDMIEVLERSLKGEGYQTLSATSGKEGLEVAWKERPHLIVLDVKMPVMDGFKVLAQLKQNEKTWDIPVIMLTAKGETSTMLQADRMHAADYVIKPVNLMQLHRSIKRALENKFKHKEE